MSFLFKGIQQWWHEIWYMVDLVPLIIRICLKCQNSAFKWSKKSPKGQILVLVIVLNASTVPNWCALNASIWPNHVAINASIWLNRVALNASMTELYCTKSVNMTKSSCIMRVNGPDWIVTNASIWALGLQETLEPITQFNGREDC